MTHIKRIDEIASAKALNEGAGAGYTLRIKGIKRNDNMRATIDSKGVYHVFVGIDRCDVEEWYAEDYYHAIDNAHYTDFIDEESDCLKIDGGSMICVFDQEQLTDQNGNLPTADEVIDYLRENLPQTLDVSCMYGGGWSHVNLGKRFTLEKSQYAYTIEIDGNGKEGGEWSDAGLAVESITVMSKTLGPAIDDYFDNPYEYDEMMY